MQIPKISVITPSYNQGEYIERTIQSVLKQGYSDLEHIIIDGVSTDITIDILKKYKHLIWVSQADKGTSDAFNKGLKMATGEIICWLNSDDILMEGAFNVAVDAFSRYPETGVVYGDCYYIDGRDKIIRNYRSREFDLKKLMTCGYNYIPPMTAFIKRSVYDRLSYPFDPELHYCMDHDLFIRIALGGAKFKYVPSCLASFRRTEENKSTKSIVKMRRESFAVSKKYGGGKYVSLYINYFFSNIYLAFPVVTDIIRKMRYRWSLMKS